MDGDWKQSYVELTDDFTIVKDQLVDLAKTAGEIHGAVGPLVAHTSEVANLMRSVNKSLSAEKMKVVKTFYRSNVTKVDEIISSANDKVT